MIPELERLRYEKKFIISNLNFHEIQDLVKCNPFIFKEIFYERNVNNIYFDSLDLKNYRENINGDSQRIKIRIRWYGKIFGEIKKPVLELKIKKNELGDKLSFPLKPFNLDKKFSNERLQDIFRKSNLPGWLIEKLKFYSPSLLNSYKRRYFMSANKKYRITLDRDLFFCKIRNKNNSFNHKETNRTDCILELKYNSKNYLSAHNITQHFPFRLTASSKYVCGIDLVNLW